MPVRSAGWELLRSSWTDLQFAWQISVELWDIFIEIFEHSGKFRCKHFINMSQIISTAETVWRIPQICGSNRHISKLSFFCPDNVSLCSGFLKMRTRVKEKIRRERSRGGHRSFHPTPRQLPYRPLVPSLQPSLVGRRFICLAVTCLRRLVQGVPFFTVFMTLSLKMSMTSENWSKNSWHVADKADHLQKEHHLFAYNWWLGTQKSSYSMAN